MPQLFPHSANSSVRVSLVILVTVVAALAWVGVSYQYGPYTTRQGQTREQPVPFSHAHHVGGLGLDCRYCHTSVEGSSFAGIPPTKTCMNCHAQIWSGSSMLAPVRDSFRTGESIRWTKVHDLPDFVYFQHDIHIAKGVGCQSCHGDVDRMPLMYQAKSLQMRWCLDCHRAPEKYLRPKDQIFNTEYTYPANQLALGRQLIQQYHVRSPQDITSCSTCHH
ncbi:MAG: cytochrome c3 family protein [Terriglobales bacterium]